jgi:hypothetical protein
MPASRLIEKESKEEDDYDTNICNFTVYDNFLGKLCQHADDTT